MGRPNKARLIAFRGELLTFFEAALEAGDAAPVDVANWLEQLAARVDDPGESKVTPAALASLAKLAADKTVTSGAARQVLDTLVAEGGDPAAIVEAQGLGAVGGADELAPIVEQALAANPDVADKLRTGDMKPIGVIVSHVMRETKGRADGGEVTRLVRAQLGL